MVRQVIFLVNIKARRVIFQERILARPIWSSFMARQVIFQVNIKASRVISQERILAKIIELNPLLGPN